MVGAAATPFTPLAESAGLSLTIETPPGIMVDADADRIRQVVRILLDNAIAYTPVVGTIRVVVERRGSRAVVAVRDTGAGIPPAEQAHVFDRFYRADRARSRGTGGAVWAWPSPERLFSRIMAKSDWRVRAGERLSGSRCRWLTNAKVQDMSAVV